MSEKEKLNTELTKDRTEDTTDLNKYNEILKQIANTWIPKAPNKIKQEHPQDFTTNTIRNP